MQKRRIWVRPFRPTDKQFFEPYVLSTKDNLFDPDVLRYPSTRMRVAHQDGEPLLYLPVQTAIVLESLAIKPDASPFQTAVSLKELFQVVAFETAAQGMGEIYFICKEPSTQEFAERNGFSKIAHPVYGIKISDLEKPHEGQ